MVEGKVIGKNLTGKVKWFSNPKGFGFLLGEGSEGDIFVHYSSIVEEGFKSLKEGQEVTYNLVETERGPQASDVRKVVKKKE
jgi:CspA family cold shock protein